MSEARETRLKRLRMRAMRRGIREMDLVLAAYADAHLQLMNTRELDTFDALLDENDQDLYQWISGREAAPPHLAGILADVARIFQTHD